MAPDHSQHISPWVATLPTAQLADTTFRDVAADVLVIGGGIAGMTTALLLQRAGKQVVVLEAARVGYGVTTHSTVKVTVGQSTMYTQIAKKLGKTAATAYAAANTAGLLRILELAEELQIDCDLEIGRHVIYAEDEQSSQQVVDEAELVTSLGLQAALTDDVPLPFPVATALAFDRQAQFHPGKYLLGIARAFVDAGGTVIENARALDVDEGSPCTVTTSAGNLSADDVVVATHYPVLNRGGHFARLEPHRSYGVALTLADDVPAGMTINAGSPTHSTRVARLDGERLLIVVGESHQVGHLSDTASRWDTLSSWGRERFGAGEPRYHWSTQEITSLDNVPYVGLISPGSDHVYTATAFAGWGMTNGTAAAMLLTDLLLGRENPWAETYDARRLALFTTGPKFVKQNLHVGKLWVKGRVAGTQPGSPRDLHPGEAAVLEVAGEQTAAYRDEQGGLHTVSAVCTHMGCTVGWNDGERSWDCPCHGSRFNHRGEVLEGPAVEALAPVPLDGGENRDGSERGAGSEKPSGSEEGGTSR